MKPIGAKWCQEVLSGAKWSQVVTSGAKKSQVEPIWSQVEPSGSWQSELEFLAVLQSGSQIIEPFYCVAIEASELCELVSVSTFKIFTFFTVSLVFQHFELKMSHFHMEMVKRTHMHAKTLNFCHVK